MAARTPAPGGESKVAVARASWQRYRRRVERCARTFAGVFFALAAVSAAVSASNHYIAFTCVLLAVVSLVLGVLPTAHFASRGLSLLLGLLSFLDFALYLLNMIAEIHMFRSRACSAGGRFPLSAPCSILITAIVVDSIIVPLFLVWGVLDFYVLVVRHSTPGVTSSLFSSTVVTAVSLALGIGAEIASVFVLGKPRTLEWHSKIIFFCMAMSSPVIMWKPLRHAVRTRIGQPSTAALVGGLAFCAGGREMQATTTPAPAGVPLNKLEVAHLEGDGLSVGDEPLPARPEGYDVVICHSPLDGAAETKWQAIQKWRSAFKGLYGKEPLALLCVTRCPTESVADWVAAIPDRMERCSHLLNLMGTEWARDMGCVLHVLAFSHLHPAEPWRLHNVRLGEAAPRPFQLKRARLRGACAGLETEFCQAMVAEIMDDHALARVLGSLYESSTASMQVERLFGPDAAQKVAAADSEAWPWSWSDAVRARGRGRKGITAAVGPAPG